MTYYAFNRHNKTVCQLLASCWEQVQTWARIGIRMPDGDLATGIGACRARLDDLAKHEQWRILK